MVCQRPIHQSISTDSSLSRFHSIRLVRQIPVISRSCSSLRSSYKKRSPLNLSYSNSSIVVYSKWLHVKFLCVLTCLENSRWWFQVAVTLQHITRNITRLSCYADNGYGSGGYTSLSVHVLSSPIVTIPVEEVQSEEGATARLSCKVSGFPEPQFHWDRDRQSRNSIRTTDTVGLQAIPDTEMPHTYTSSLVSTHILKPVTQSKAAWLKFTKPYRRIYVHYILRYGGYWKYFAKVLCKWNSEKAWQGQPSV